MVQEDLSSSESTSQQFRSNPKTKTQTWEGRILVNVDISSSQKKVICHWLCFQG